MRRPFTTQEAYDSGITRHALRWGVRVGTWRRVARGVYIEGDAPPTPMERALAVVTATSGVASGTLAGQLYGLDSIELIPPFATIPAGRDSRHKVRRADVVPTTVQRFPCTEPLQTLEDLAEVVDDLTWEQAMESALHKGLIDVSQLHSSNDQRIKRVMALRPPGAAPAESLLETLMIQLIRDEPSLPDPSRQVLVHNQWNQLVARVDLAWPEVGVFLELDGEHHKDQPVYDASRQTAVIAITGWLPGRFTWHEVNHAKRATRRRLVELYAQASRRRSA